MLESENNSEFSPAKREREDGFIYAEDYKAPEYLVDHIEMVFDIQSDVLVQVHGILSMRKNAETGLGNVVLNKFKDLQVDKVLVDGVQVNVSVSDDFVWFSAPGSDEFTVEVFTTVNPESNKSGEGLYVSGNMLVTQCEPEGFRRFMPYIDTPDNLATFKVTIEAGEEKYPVTLSNGNLVKEDSENEIVRRTYEDPFRKPSYLFALVAGNLDKISDTYTTGSGKDINLEIYAEGKETVQSCRMAMEALKESMVWDENRWGLECDLTDYKIVADHAFVHGAMENKGLNVFNTKYVVADPKISTDDEITDMRGVIAHEYLHNYTGNRVTCRDWFQLTLKEGLTVFRDQEFTADHWSPVLARIDAVNGIKGSQFKSDAGPNAHSIKPLRYKEINNFYTSTIYNKGAEVIRMIHTLIGEEKFRKGLNKYLKDFDGQAVTTKDFVRSMAEASGVDLSQFEETWYSRKGTPVCNAEWKYDEQKKALILNVKQSVPDQGGDKDKDVAEGAVEGSKPYYFPFVMGLIGEDGKEIPLNLEGEKGLHDLDRGVLHISEMEQQFVFTGVETTPVVSCLRNFSAPIKLNVDYSNDELMHLMANDTDLYNRYEAKQIMSRKVLKGIIEGVKSGKEVEVPKEFLDAYEKIFDLVNSDPAFGAEMMNLPSVAEMVADMEFYDYELAEKAWRLLMKEIAVHFEQKFSSLYDDLSNDDYAGDKDSMGRRAFKNACLAYLCWTDDEKYVKLAVEQAKNADNMTDEKSAVQCLTRFKDAESEATVMAFYEKWKGNPVVVDSWFGMMTSARRDDCLERVKFVENNIPEYNRTNPNNIRSLLFRYIVNRANFHAVKSESYDLIADRVEEIDGFNPMVSASLFGFAFEETPKMDEERKGLMLRAVKRVMQKKDLSINVKEIAENIIKGSEG